MTEPTDEQVKEFWEWCGFYQEDGESYMDSTPYKVWKHPSNLLHDFGYKAFPGLLVDLNNLFKYAVPKVTYCELIKVGRPDYHGCWCGYVSIRPSYELGKALFVEDEDPALALFWAIYKVMEGKEIL